MKHFVSRLSSSLLSILLLSIFVQSQSVSFVARRDLAAGSNANFLAVADVNHDGRLDMIVANANTNSVLVMLGKGDGTFAAAMSSPAGQTPGFIAVADINGDKNPDLVVVNQNTSNISILIGRGDGTFQAPVAVGVEFNSIAIAVADFNGDGNQDLAVSANSFFGPGTVSILLGNGNGTFRPRQNFAVGSFPAGLTVGDFNGDHKLDVATANENSNDVSVLLGRGDGTFLPASSVSVGSSPRALVTADFDGNGAADLAVTDTNSDEVSILLGRGDGTFLNPLNIAVPSGPTLIAVADLNGDQVPDILTVHPGQFPSGMGSISVLLGNGDGSFSSPGLCPLSGNPTALAVGDFNSDGFVDVTVSESFSGSSSGVISELL